MKHCLKKTLRNAKVTSAELYTLVIEIEGTLNNRPLTYLSADEFDKALTPNHLICGRRLEQLVVYGSNYTQVSTWVVPKPQLPSFSGGWSQRKNQKSRSFKVEKLQKSRSFKVEKLLKPRSSRFF